VVSVKVSTQLKVTRPSPLSLVRYAFGDIMRYLLTSLLIPFMSFQAFAGDNLVTFDVLNSPNTSTITLSSAANNDTFYELLTESEYYDDAEKYKKLEPNKVYTVDLEGFRSDLNGDGSEEIFVVFACGKRECGVNLFDGKNFKQIGYFEGYEISILSNERMNSYHKICTSRSNGDYESDKYTSCYKFENGEYVEE